MCQYLYVFMHRVERATASVKCLVQEHRTALTQTSGSRVQCTKHETTVPTSVKGKSVGEMQRTISIIFWVPLLAVFLEFNMASFAFLARRHYLEISKNVLLTMFLCILRRSGAYCSSEVCLGQFSVEFWYDNRTCHVHIG